jgi:hypothetical protein
VSTSRIANTPDHAINDPGVYPKIDGVRIGNNPVAPPVTSSHDFANWLVMVRNASVMSTTYSRLIRNAASATSRPHTAAPTAAATSAGANAQWCLSVRIAYTYAPTPKNAAWASER